MPRQTAPIDRDKLRAAVRKLGHEYFFYMLDEAIDLLPSSKLEQIAKGYLDVENLRSDSESTAKVELLEAVRAFDKASRAGDYYESFFVNSKNCMEQSTGTMAWIADYRRILDRCVAERKKVRPAEAKEAFGILFGLLDYIDEGNDDVIFFADEGGSWQVCVDWDRVLPPWFRVLSATADPNEYAERITSLLEHHYNWGIDKMLVVARKTGTREQREALADLQARRRRGGATS